MEQKDWSPSGNRSWKQNDRGYRQERPQRAPYWQQQGPPSRQNEAASQDTTIVRREFDVENKKITVLLKENRRGKFVRIVEETHGKHSSVVFPESGITDLLNALTDILQPPDPTTA